MIHGHMNVKFTTTTTQICCDGSGLEVDL